jgi:hypothetical protein
MHVRSLGLALAALLLVPKLAAAQAPDSDSVTKRSSPRHGAGERDLHFQGGIGYSSDDELDGAVVQDLLASVRFGYIEAGLFGTFGSELFGPTYAAYGVAAGPVVQTDSGIRAGLLGELGGDSYSSVDCSLFCEGGGASATLPYAGARLSMSSVFKAGGRAHLELGMMGFYGRDLEQREVDYTTTGGLFSSGEVSEHTTTIGGERVGATLNAGLTVDL